MKSAKTYLLMWERLSPIECRLAARRSWRTPLTMNEIAERSGLTMQKIRWITSQETWERVTIGDASRFRFGCGITPSNESRHIAYLSRTQSNKRGAMAHLDKLKSRPKRRLLNLM